MQEDMYNKAKEFEKKNKVKFEQAWKKHEEFIKRFSFREHPEMIDDLTPEKIWTKGNKNSFLYWPEFGLEGLGRVHGRSAKYLESAKNNIEKFKKLLKQATDDSISLSEKVDATWEDMKWWGGDKIVAKKIIFLYYPDDVIPIFKTDDLKHFVNELHKIEPTVVYDSDKSYGMSSIGQKFGILNKLLIKYKNSTPTFKNWDNALFTYFLYKYFPKYLFSWDNIPGNDNVRLIEFLTRKFGIDWVKIAEIEKIDDGRTIRLIGKNNFLSLKLNNEKTKVILEISDVRTYEFIAKTENGKLNIYFYLINLKIYEI